MSSISLYDVTVPAYIYQLQELKEVLKKGEKWAEDEGKDKETLLQGRLYPDMLPLINQIRIISDMSKSLVVYLSGAERVSIADTEATFADLYARLDKTIDVLQAAKRESFKGPEAEFTIALGPQGSQKFFKYNALDYVQKFSVPNFYFHKTTAYAILRNQGVPLGKRDFLGLGAFSNPVDGPN